MSQQSGHVVVTGASGLVGSAIVRRLGAAGRPVTGVDRVPSPDTSVVADLRDPAAWRRALSGAGAVVHTAALHAPHVGVHPDDEFREINVGATRDLLDASAAAGVRRFVYTSSTSVYGHALEPTDEAVWVTEDVTCRPRDIYDETKLAAERLVLSTAGTMSTVCLRIARCFPEPPAVRARHRLHRGVDVADVAEAHLLAVRGPREATGVLNIAGPYPWRAEDRKQLWHDPAALITRRLPEVAAGFGRLGWTLPVSIDRVYVSARAGAVLGYRPRHGVTALLAEARAGG
ncbi:NAD-dependent epimerase/dehydratase family protein [Streptomyces populi]|uniref:NAD-dependent epimerase/dehydratase family protein n=1 Tax=Streptomyces populi TaxID=2058924 RepID=UPI001F0BAF58|nr:NAD(P)-dependent oxidoreductase [Streptomyces populi]